VLGVPKLVEARQTDRYNFGKQQFTNLKEEEMSYLKAALLAICPEDDA